MNVLIDGLCFSVLDALKFRSLNDDRRKLPSFLFRPCNGCRKARTIKKETTEISRCASRIKGRLRHRGARARQFKVTNLAVKGAP